MKPVLTATGIREYIQESREAATMALQGNRQLDVILAGVMWDLARFRGRVFACGNGGSATLANHFVMELAGVARACEAYSLCQSVSWLTMIGNDHGWAKTMSMQLPESAGAADWLWVFSGSGTSSNIVGVARDARGRGMRVTAVVGPPRAGDEKPHVGEWANDCLLAPTSRQRELELFFFWIMHTVAYLFISEDPVRIGEGHYWRGATDE